MIKNNLYVSTFLFFLTGSANAEVSCGGHEASSCVQCPVVDGKDNGATYCNGECVWKDGACTGTATTGSTCSKTIDDLAVENLAWLTPAGFVCGGTPSYPVCKAITGWGTHQELKFTNGPDTMPVSMIFEEWFHPPGGQLSTTPNFQESLTYDDPCNAAEEAKDFYWNTLYPPTSTCSYADISKNIIEIIDLFYWPAEDYCKTKDVSNGHVDYVCDSSNQYATTHVEYYARIPDDSGDGFSGTGAAVPVGFFIYYNSASNEPKHSFLSGDGIDTCKNAEDIVYDEIVRAFYTVNTPSWYDPAVFDFAASSRQDAIAWMKSQPNGNWVKTIVDNHSDPASISKSNNEEDPDEDIADTDVATTTEEAADEEQEQEVTAMGTEGSSSSSTPSTRINPFLWIFALVAAASASVIM